MKIVKHPDRPECEIRYEAFDTIMSHNIPLFKDGELIGRAFIVEPIDDPWKYLMDIQLYEEKHRGKGYGTLLMDYIKNNFNMVRTRARNPKVRNFYP